MAPNSVRLAHRVYNREDSVSRVLGKNLVKRFGVADLGKVLDFRGTG